MLDFGTLPLPFTLLLYVLAATVFSLIFLLPIILIFKTEVDDFIAWCSKNLNKNNQPNSVNSISSLFTLSANYLSAVNVLIGRLACWLVLAMVLMQFTVVLMRYVFSFGSTQMQESIWYMHGLLFTLGVGYTLYREGHVRIDLIYRKMTKKTKAIVNIFGVLLFVIPLCWITLDIAYPYVMNAWEVKEGSTEGSGLHYVYLIKSSILAFATLLLLQGISMLLKSLALLLSSDTRHNELTH